MPLAQGAARAATPCRPRRLTAAALILLTRVVGPPSRAAPACLERDSQPPSERAAWNRQHALRTASSPSELEATGLTPGRTVRAVLRPVGSIRFVARPGRPARTGEFGGMLQARIPQPGAYRVLLGSKAWLDVLKDGSALVPTGHAPGPACGPVRKTVEFQLDRGDYVFQVSANPDPVAVILVIPRPGDRIGRAE
jgi:hypothetical protein